MAINFLGVYSSPNNPQHNNPVTTGYIAVNDVITPGESLDFNRLPNKAAPTTFITKHATPYPTPTRS